MKSFCRDQSGGTAVLIALLLPVMIGFVGLGVDVGLWYTQARTAQNAADSAALSAAFDGNREAALAVAAAYHLNSGVNGVHITVNQSRGRRDGEDAAAIEVQIERPTPRLFSRMFLQAAQSIKVRAVAQRRCDGNANCTTVLVE